MPKKEESPYQLANKENTQFKKKVGFCYKQKQWICKLDVNLII